MFDINCSNLTCHLRKVSDNSLSLTSMLSSDLVSETANELNLGFRNRIFTPFLTLFAFLSQIFNDDHSCRHAVAEVNALFLAKKLKLCSFGTSSFCKAKARLSLNFLRIIALKLNAKIENSANEKWNWKHGRVVVVDGTGFSMPDTPDNLTFFPRHNSKKSNVGFPVGRLVAIFSLATGALIDAEIAPWKGKESGELTLLNRLWGCFKSGDTLLGDSLYSSYWVVAKALQSNLHVVAEFRESCGWRLSKKKHDQIITISNPSKKSPCLSDKEHNALPSQITVRVVRLICAPNGFRPKRKTIVTTHLNSKTVTAYDVCALYKQRWQVEINLRSIKTVLGMDVLRGKTQEMVKKEVWAHLIAYNLIRITMVNTASVLKKLPNEISFRATSQALCVIRFMVLLTGKSEGIDLFLITMLSSTKVGHRPDRYEPRALKRRKKNFAFLSQPRGKMRKKLCKKYKRKYASS